MLALVAALLLQSSFDDLLRGLREESPAERERATRAIVEGSARWNDAELAALRAATGDADVEVASRAASALVRIDIRRRVGIPAPGLLEGIDEKLPTVSPERRLQLLKTAGWLVEQGQMDASVLAGLVAVTADHGWPLPPRELLELVASKRETREARPYLPLLPALLSSPDQETAQSAVLLLGRHGAVEHYARILPLLADPKSPCLPLCVDVLGTPDIRALAPQVAALAVRDAQPVRLAAVEVLGRMGAVEHAAVVARRLGPGTDADELRIVATALGLMAASRHADAVASLLTHEDRDLRVAAAQALGRMGLPAFGTRLVPLLKDVDTGVREAAVEALARLRPADAVPELVPLLTDRDPGARGYAAQTLGLIGARSEARAIVAVLAHDHPWSRSQALRALGRLGAADQTDELARCLDDEWELVRLSAALGLAELPRTQAGTAAVLKRLQDLRQDFTEEVRDAALTAQFRLADGFDALAEAHRYSEETVEVLARGLAAKHDPEADARLDVEFTLKHPVDSRERLVQTFALAGFWIDLAECPGTIGRIPEGRRVTARRLAALCWDGVLAVPDGPRLRILSSASAISHWRTRLAKR